MKPDWDKLADAFRGSSTVLIADVDCTAPDAEAVCQSNGVEGYPTIKYYNESNGMAGEKYEGARDFKSLKKFVKKTLKGTERVCDVSTKADCSPEELAYLEKWEGKPAADIKAEASRLKKKLGDVLKTEARKQFEFEAKLLSSLTKDEEKPKKRRRKSKAEL
mmetsp:Transcript_14098/g.24813  ORF Transcript_14098/g.24813 Transcript_14098/m.24813 type:complete len:162 (+) Transcript_14098:276-761(+)